MADKQQPIMILKHLRTIHFLIVLASLLTLLSIYSEPSGDVRVALKQISQITGVRSSWKTWSERFALEQADWLRSLRIKWLDLDVGMEPVHIETQQLKDKGLIPESESPIWKFQLEGLPVYFFVNINPSDNPSRIRKLILARPFGRLNASDALLSDIYFPGFGNAPPFTTIKEFRELWENARYPMACWVEELAHEVRFFIGNDIAATVPVKMYPEEGNTLDFKNSTLDGCRNEKWHAVFEKVPEKSYGAFFCRDIHGGSMIIAARFKKNRIPVDLQQWLIKWFGLPGPAGTFSDSFPELDRVTRDYQELTIEKAHAIIEAELARGGERIEFLGMKLPGTLMATWGGAIILMLQMYFWLHIRVVRGVGWTLKELMYEVAWIGIYSDIFARIITLITIFLIPFGTTIYAVIITGVPAKVAVILSLLVGLVSGLSAGKVWSLSK